MIFINNKRFITMRIIKINESQHNRLFESATSVLFHYINLDYLVDALEKNALRTCDPEKTLDYLNGVTKYINGEDVRFISLTRNGNPSEGYPIMKYGEFGDGELSCICRLTLDGNALNVYSNFKDKNGKRQNMKFQPIDWAYNDGIGFESSGYGDGKNWMMHSDDSTYSPAIAYDDMWSSEDTALDGYSDKYHHPYAQAEDRLLTKSEYIPNANKYIKQIDIYIRKFSHENYVVNDLKEQMPYIKKIKRLAKKLGIPCLIHSTINDFRRSIHNEGKSFNLNEAYRNGFSFETLSSLSGNWEKQYEYCRKWLGESFADGSSRCVFTLSDNMVLKLAFGGNYEAGIKQNEAEYNIFKKTNSPLLVRVFDCDENFTYLVCEHVIPCEEEDFEKILGMPFWNDKIFADYKNPTVYNILSYIETNYLLDEGKVVKEAEEIIKKNPWFRELARLVSEGGLGDFCNYENFGLANRDGRPSIVILDGGLNMNIWNKYYNDDKDYGSNDI